jgi:hypothetical protein
MQQSLAQNGKTLDIKLSHNSVEHKASIGSNCTVAQLKLLISAYFDVPVSSMSVICKGATLKNNAQLLKDTKIVNGVKVMVMSSSK